VKETTTWGQFNGASRQRSQPNQLTVLNENMEGITIRKDIYQQKR
jgi:hypothetical protein